MLSLFQRGSHWGKSRWQSSRMLSSLPHNKHVKKYPTCWAILTGNKLETGRKGLCNKGCKERSIESQVGREKQQAGRNFIPSGGHRRGDWRSHNWRAFLGSKDMVSYIWYPNPGVWHWGVSFSSVQSFSRARLFATPWTATLQVSFFITNSQSLLKLMSIELVMPSNHLILCPPLLLLLSVFISIRVFSKDSVICIRWPKHCSFSFSIILPMNIRDWFPLRLIGWISLQAKGFSRVFSNTTVQKHQFFCTQLSSQSNSYIHTWPLEKLWCWEGLGAGGEGDNRGWDGWMASLTRWLWIWGNPRSWWWTGRPGVLWFIRSDMTERLNWTDLPCPDLFQLCF